MQLACVSNRAPIASKALPASFGKDATRVNRTAGFLTHLKSDFGQSHQMEALTERLFMLRSGL